MAASYEGNIRTLTNVNGKAFMAFDSRHQSLVAALHRLENPNAEPTAEEKSLLPPTIPPLTLDWLFGLNNDEFLHFYHDTHGGPSIALGREWALYLRERNAVRPWLDALRDGLLRRRTFTVQAWIARDLAWAAAAAALPGKTRDQIESDFRAWVLNRTISDEGHLAGIQKSWEEASAAFTGGNLVDAMAKAGGLKEKATEIMGLIGMQPPAPAPAEAPAAAPAK